MVYMLIPIHTIAREEYLEAKEKDTEDGNCNTAYESYHLVSTGIL